MKLQKLMGQLERSTQELDNFAYLVSHDLKEPLSGIDAYSKLLMEDYSEELGSEGRAHLEILQRLSKRMEKLVDTLLQYSRVSELELSPKKTDLDSLLDKVLDSLRVTVEKSGATINVPRPLPVVDCDGAWVREVFSSLIGNAITYNDKEENRVEIGWQDKPKQSNDGSENSHPVFYVRDNGMGIDEEEKSKVFDLFTRLKSRIKFGEGIGASLAIARKVVEKHGGEIWLESQPSEGTTFYFTLA